MPTIRRPLWGAFLLGLLVSPAVAQDRAFAPDAATVSLAATTTTGRVQIQASAGNSPHVRLYNPGSVAVFVTCGSSTVTATLAAGMPIAPASVEVIACTQTHIAGITASGAVTLYATPGNGI